MPPLSKEVVQALKFVLEPVNGGYKLGAIIWRRIGRETLLVVIIPPDV